MQMKQLIEKFVNELRGALAAGAFVKLSLGHYVGSDDGLKQIHVRRILIKDAERLSFTYRYKTRDIVKNYDDAHALGLIGAALDTDFKVATLFTTTHNLVFENGQLRRTDPRQVAPPPTAHNASKKKWVPTTGAGYLADLKITDKQGRVFDKAQDKYRQINKYIEIIDSLTRDMPADYKLNIADMGAGKGYLTFALYDYFRNVRQLDAHVTGVEYRADLVTLCNDIAGKAGFSGLSFVQGSIADFDAAAMNILIALHACDTATDDALAKGIRAEADLIIVAPCCHKQIRREMEGGMLADAVRTVTRHGIFMERQAEMVTDALRGLLLERAGYDVKIFEFVSGEHTAKNVMIVGQKGKKRQRSAKTDAQIDAVKAAYGVTTHYLEKLLD